MRKLILGLLCLVGAVLVAARNQDLRADDIDAELEALERAVRAKQEAYDLERNDAADDEDEREIDLSDLTEDEILALLQENEDSDDLKRELESGAKKRIFGWRKPRIPPWRKPRIPPWRKPRLPPWRKPRIPPWRKPRIPPWRKPWGKK